MEKNFVTGDLLAQGAAYTVMGICIVFLILIIIMFVIKAMALFSAQPEKKPEPEAPAAPEPAAEISGPDEAELVAVITAAVAASLNKSAASIRVRSYKRADTWNKAGRREVLDNRI